MLMLLTGCAQMDGADFPQERQIPEYNIKQTTFPAVPLLWDDANVYVTC